LSERELPESLVRRPLECSLLDVAVGSGSMEMTRYLIEFHGATATREALKQSLTTGNQELIKLMRERLPDGELRDRVDLLRVAIEYHQPDVLGWLLRDATVFERELLGVFLFERRLADSLVVGLDGGLLFWWSRTRALSLKWRPSANLELARAPRGFSSEGGWWTTASGAASALPALGPRSMSGIAQPRTVLALWRRRVVSGFPGMWTEEASEALLGGKAEVKSVVFPVGVTAFGKEALYEFATLESVVFPPSCTSFSDKSFADCKSLRAVSLPAGCKATGYYAFARCSSLVCVEIPVGCREVSEGSFRWCSSLTRVRIPNGCACVGYCSFSGGSIKEITIPDRCEVDEQAFEQCTRLTTVTVGVGCKAIGHSAFEGCAALASVRLPFTLEGVGAWAFGDCPALDAIAIPRKCRVDSDAFSQSPTRVVRV
jgi:hypothetical protein